MATLAFALCFAAPAQAQLGASLGVHSEFRYRGRALSDGRPALTAAVSYDNPSGLYLGATALAGRVRGDQLRLLRSVAYGGYVTQATSGPNLDFGVGTYHVVDPRGGVTRTYDYAEIYGGVVADHVTFRAHYAPDYYESGVDTLYADLSVNFRAGDDTRLFAHAGLLTKVGGRNLPVRDRRDFSLGIARDLGPVELAATWTTTDPEAYGPDRRRESRDAVILSLTCFF